MLVLNRSMSGLFCAVLSAAAFGISGPLGKILLQTGWSPGAAIGMRLGIAALAMASPAVLMMHQQWRRLRRSLGFMAVYGTVTFALCQFCYLTL